MNLESTIDGSELLKQAYNNLTLLSILELTNIKQREAYLINSDSQVSTALFTPILYNYNIYFYFKYTPIEVK